MARHTFGGGAADFVAALGLSNILVVKPSTLLTMWTAVTGGTQITDLLDASNNPVTTITSDTYGNVPKFSGPNDGTAVLWADAGGGARVALHATDTESRTAALETGKVDTTRLVNGHALSADVTVTKGDVGLGNVDNTSDVNKPASTAQAAADALRLKPTGAWQATTAYSVNDSVTANGVAWRCILAHTSGASFSADPTKWERFGVGQVVSAQPSSLATDDLWYDKTNDLWKRWNGSASVTAGNATYAPLSVFRSTASGSGNGAPNVIVGYSGNAIAADIGSGTILGGGQNNYENVIGGDGSSTVGLGPKSTHNIAQTGTNANYSLVGGYDSVAGGLASVIIGMHCYTKIGSSHGAVSGGSLHVIGVNNYSSIGGGTQNATGDGADNSRVCGGVQNTASGGSSVVSGGSQNTASGANTFIGSGANNLCATLGSVVVGGTSNQVQAGGSGYSFLGGGTGNNITAGSSGVLVGGSSNTVSASTATVVGGTSNTASAVSASVLGGQGGTASGTCATVTGGRDSTASASYSVASGRQANASQYGQRAHSAGAYTTLGDCQAGTYLLRNTTTDATANVDLYLDGTATRILVPALTTWAFSITVTAHRTDVSGDARAWRFDGVTHRSSGSTHALVGTPTKLDLGGTPAWSCQVVATTGGVLAVQVTGEAGKTIRWTACIETVEVTG